MGVPPTHCTTSTTPPKFEAAELAAGAAGAALGVKEGAGSAGASVRKIHTSFTSDLTGGSWKTIFLLK